MVEWGGDGGGGGFGGRAVQSAFLKITAHPITRVQVLLRACTDPIAKKYVSSANGQNQKF